jgi:hypothetical protein
MLTIRRANERGHFTNDWLDSYHSFSFGDYFDPAHMGFSALRVINEDRILPEGGFATHPHRNMEIITYVMAGELAHKDSMGNGSIIGPGEVQRMSAGKGVRHSEFNPSGENETHLLQIWLQPKVKGIEPGYEQKAFADEEKQGQLKLLVSSDGRSGSVTVHSDASLYSARLAEQETVEYRLADDRIAYVYVAQGRVDLNGEQLEAGDAAGLVEAKSISLTGIDDAEILLFDLPE